jgi:hypothetical protein
VGDIGVDVLLGARLVAFNLAQLRHGDADRLPRWLAMLGLLATVPLLVAGVIPSPIPEALLLIIWLLTLGIALASGAAPTSSMRQPPDGVFRYPRP